MAQQLTIFDVWEEVQPKVPPAPVRPPEPVLEPIPVLPGQQSLLTGVHLGEAEVDQALSLGDAPALRAVGARILLRYPQYAPAQVWATWAGGLESLAAGDPVACLAAAERLDDPDFAGAHFPEMSPERFAALHEATFLRAVRAVLLADGPLARGAPPYEGWAATVLLRFDALREARTHFESIVRTHPEDATAWRALARCRVDGGAGQAANTAWLMASMLAPEATARDPHLPPALADAMAWAEDLELSGAPAEWLAALADLRGVASLPKPDALPPVRDAEPAGITFARDLATLRALRRRRALAEEFRPVKAALLAAAPALKEALRGV